MNEENKFIRAILDDPRDVNLRLVYADWLEERGDPDSARRAEYLRTECTLDTLPAKDKKRHHLQDRLRHLRTVVGDDWWQALDCARVEYCVEFEYQCPQRWDMLTPTGDPAIRHCSECQQDVHYTRSGREARRLADAGMCVAIDSRLARLPLSRVRNAARAGRLLGKVSAHVPHRIPLPIRGAKHKD